MERKIRDKSVKIILTLWRKVDWDNISASRRMGIYDEFENKLRAAASTNTIQSFLERIRKKMGLKSLNETDVIADIEENGDKILHCIRTETSYLMLKLRKHQEDKKDDYYNKVRERLKEENCSEKEINKEIAELKGEVYDEFEDIDPEIVNRLFNKQEDDE